MRKNLAIYITDARGVVECLWEFPLNPRWYSVEDAEILAAFKSGAEDWPSDLDEPDGWREWKMEIRHYEK